MAFVLVPADGNCMVWSIRTLMMGLPHCSKSSQKTANKEQKQFRHMLKNLWIAKKSEPAWQLLFQALCLEVLQGHQTDQDLATPEKQCKRKPQTPLNLLTPPPVEDEARKKRKLLRGGDVAPAPGFARKGAETKFRTREGAVSFLEKPIPDLANACAEGFEKQRTRVVPQSNIKVEPADPLIDDDQSHDSLSLSEGLPALVSTSIECILFVQKISIYVIIL